MPKTLVLFHSRTGRTARLAEAVANGARSVPFAEVDVRRIADVTDDGERSDASSSAPRDEPMSRHRVLASVDTLEEYDGLILGSPARYGVMAAEVQRLLDAARALQQRGALADRVGAAFASAADGEGGAETTVWSMLMALSHFGMLLVPPPYGAAAGTVTAAPHEHAHAHAHAHSHSHSHHHAHPHPPAPPSAPADAPAPPTDPALAAAWTLGRRVATVVEWVTHVKQHH